MKKEAKILFEPSGRTVHALPGTTILEAAGRAGLILHSPCGGGGKCGKCLVRVRSGNLPATPGEAAVLGERRLAEGFRMACAGRITGPATLEIPDTSLLQSHQQILTDDSGEALAVLPRVRKLARTVRPAAMHESCSDLDRLREAGVDAPLSTTALQSLPAALRAAANQVTVVTVDEEVIAIEPGDTTPQCFGIAFDVGTTTLVGTLVELATGRDVAVAARINPQTSFGDDVISRLHRCRSEASGLHQLQTAVLEGINKLVDELERKAGVPRLNVYEVVFAGNTAMQQILCGIDPSALGELPFAPAFREALEWRAADLKLHVHPCAKVYVFPQIGGFVGGDTTAGILATRLDQATRPTLLVDIGTNGELVLAHGDRMLAASVAAGPAFEGARITHGMRATSGAIEKVIIEGTVRLNVIGNCKPSGLCGTGLIDAAADLLRVGILDPTGRILGPDELPANLSPDLRERVVEIDGEHHFLLVKGVDSATGQPLHLFQRDLRELQLASAAIRAGITILLKTAGVPAEALDAILLAGGFGNFIRRSNARRIGMLPPIPCSRIRFVGNTSSFGAKRALLSIQEKEKASALLRKTQHVDLSLDAGFQEEFGNAMMLPEEEPAGADAADR